MMIYSLLVASVLYIAACEIFDKNPIDIFDIYRDETAPVPGEHTNAE